jgi:hypothetical protein
MRKAIATEITALGRKAVALPCRQDDPEQILSLERSAIGHFGSASRAV